MPIIAVLQSALPCGLGQRSGISTDGHLTSNICMAFYHPITGIFAANIWSDHGQFSPPAIRFES